MDGLIFDIQRCSLRDGPGIRTTVFLKGCPLRCLWCHNPESMAREAELSFDRERCVNCLACVSECPSGAHRKIAERHHLQHMLCQACGKCIEICPNDAVKIVGRRWSVDQVLAEVERDRAYYAGSGGGITLSGGEPMLQFEFTLALLTQARARGLHTCLETSGFTPAGRLEAVRPFVDLFLFDYKETASARHRALTGVPNELILSNLEKLMQSGAKLILRCPIVPGINDSPGHLQGIAELAARYPALETVEILPYHDLGRHKANRLAEDRPLPEMNEPDEAAKRQWLAKLHEWGCTKAKLG